LVYGPAFGLKGGAIEPDVSRLLWLLGCGGS
jgi:hypothetical protein